MESTFIEIANPPKIKYFCGIHLQTSIYGPYWLIYNYFNRLLENIYKGQKPIFLLGDFNINLLSFNEHNQTSELLDSLASNPFMPLVLQRTRITSYSNTLIDNIFSNVVDADKISGNLTATIFDHLPQFAIILKYLTIS